MKYPNSLGCLLGMLLSKIDRFNRRLFLDACLRLTIKSLGMTVLILTLLLVLFLITKSLPLFNQPEIQIRALSLSFEHDSTQQSSATIQSISENSFPTSSLVFPDQPTKRWQGGQWRVDFSPKSIHFELMQKTEMSLLDDRGIDTHMKGYRQSLALPT